MGIHFVCHHCSYALHVKDFQAGKRGKCPNCKGSFRIPANDSSYSSAIEDSSEVSAVTNVRNAFQQASKKASPKQDQSSDSIAIAMEPNPVSKSISNDSKKATDHSQKSSDTKTAKKESKVAAVKQKASIDSPMMPTALNEAADANWFVRPPSGGQFGPAPSHLLMAWIAECRVTAESYLWREGFADWQLASELVPELFQGSSGTSKAPPSLTEILSDGASNPSVMEIKPDSASATRAGLLLKKQMQKRRQQLMMIVMLAIVSLILFGILIFVLVFQATKSPQPAQSHIPSETLSYMGG